MQQALERAGIKSNHGWNYAMDAIEMASLMRQLRPNLQNQSNPKFLSPEAKKLLD
jgi:6,7-dimethyl-8-ribityllumazine synthase